MTTTTGAVLGAIAAATPAGAGPEDGQASSMASLPPGVPESSVLDGPIQYHASPPERCGPGMWFFEPADACHEATQQASLPPGASESLVLNWPVGYDASPPPGMWFFEPADACNEATQQVTEVTG
eukprot:CAMPEP_0171069608 /NCGR_PEP_ID=MMETSP0766_2-20121228/9249_1 /TAXON_ID=439317 /ORGANISM="Gambierdiscus australes, Strain CAWD 149" /LENGTH=124 /DNA_ID=CAMNT_0011526001 /DNA_START=206 /DNA_END=579 /DNA_ORIENTATION=+